MKSFYSVKCTDGATVCTVLYCTPYPKFTQTGVGVIDATGVCAAPSWRGATQRCQGGCWEAWGGTAGRRLETQHATELRKTVRKTQKNSTHTHNVSFNTITWHHLALKWPCPIEIPLRESLSPSHAELWVYKPDKLAHNLHRLCIKAILGFFVDVLWWLHCNNLLQCRY